MKRLLVLLALIVPVLSIVYVPLAHADVNNFTITNFASDQTLSNSDRQGELHIVETIDVTFTDNNHGLIRAIPNDYNGQPLNFKLNKVTSKSGAPATTEQSFENSNVVLKIGDPDKTVTGPQSYTIDYTVQNVISFYDNHDELYWDVNGDQWAQPTTHVQVSLHLPSGITLSSDKPQCFSGEYGAEQSNCTVTNTANELNSNASNLLPNQTLTYVIGFTKGYFVTQSTADTVKDNLNPLLSLIILPITALIGGSAWWWRKGRDAKGRGVIVPQYESPKDISPLEAGTLLDFKTDNRDITATIIDLARRGYIRIHETVKDRKILKDKLTYKLELRNDNQQDLSEYEKGLLSGIFGSQSVGDTVELGKVNTSLVSAVESIRRSVPRDLKTKGYIAKQSYWTGIYLVGGVAVVATILAIIFGNRNAANIPEIIGGALISILAIAVFWSLMSARTKEGTELREQLLGLKMFMELTEKERIAKLQAPNAAYAENRGEPMRTVELFEKLLPYAIIMGVENQWAKQFEGLYKTPPGWYNGNSAGFNSLYLAGALNSNMGQAMASSFTPPSSSSSSGFGGGGFSGGGGGGGGGGGW